MSREELEALWETWKAKRIAGKVRGGFPFAEELLRARKESHGAHTHD